VAEADQVERRGRQPLEVVARVHPARELLRPSDLPLDVRAQPLHAVVADHQPELERPEAAAERDLPVAVIDHRARLRRLVLQVLGRTLSARTSLRSATNMQSQSKW
jgi:hypothetical protein